MDTGTVNIFSPTECLKIVQNFLKLQEGVEILSYHVQRGASDLVGFMGEYYKLIIKVQIGNIPKDVKELQYFVKSVPISNPFHKDECERKGFFPKETRIYSEILPHIQRYASNKLFPVCYYTRPDVMVLEDLTSAAGNYRHRNAKEPYTSEDHKLFLKHLAQLHAASIAWEVFEGVDIYAQFKDVLIEIQLTMNNEWYETGIKGIMFLAKRYRKFQTPSIQNFIEEHLYSILTEAESYTLPVKTQRNVLCHRDSWDRNIFFSYNALNEPTGCCIVDFQLTRYSPPATDVLFFLYGTTTQEQRNELMSEYLKFYYAALQKRLRELKLPEDTITEADFKADCKRARVPVLILWAICKPLTMMPEGCANKLRAEDQEKFDYYMNTQRDEMFLRIMEMDETYEGKIMWPIEQLIEILLENYKK